MKKNTDNLSSRGNAGFTLVDVMVGMVIGLLGIIIIFQVFAVSESNKRTTTSGGDAQQNAAAAQFGLEHSIKNAGYGLFSCFNTPPIPQDCAAGNTQLPAVTITPGTAATGNSDTLVLTYRQTWDFGSFPPTTTLSQTGTFPYPPVLTNETIDVEQANGSTTGLLQLVSKIAASPVVPTYTVCTPSATCLPTKATSSVISEGIVLMKAEYGVDNGAGGVFVAGWQQTPPAAGVNVLAVRVALVARSAQPEVTKDSTGKIVACATTTVFPTWIDSANVKLDISKQLDLLAAGDNWQCYRYKTFENTVPLRNVLWKPL